jgi:pullulanase
MHSTLNGTLYQFTATLPAGSYQYKVATPGWGSSWPVANVDLVLNGTEQVTFYYAPNGNQVTDSINNSGQPLPGDPGWKSNVLAVNLKSSLNVRHVYQVSASATSSTPALQGITVVPRNVLDGSAYYYGGQLGAVYSKKATTFRLWAPDATKVVLQLFKTETGGVKKTVTMKPAKKGGIVQATVKGNLANEYYVYQVSALGQIHAAVDPYAQNVTPNGTRAMVVNLTATNPAGWTSDHHVGAANPVDASIYEVHVRDFTIDANSGVAAANRGTYLGFTQTGTTGPGGVSTGIDSLKQLGVKDVELMPTYRFATLDETKSYSAFCPDVSAGAGNPCYNWGYDPANYNAPEGAYATSAHGTARISQFKQMVHAIHTAGMGVILDAVYNHVFDTSVFNNIVPQYYFRTSRFGVYYNGSGQGNEVATEKPMVFKFAEDSMKYWMQQYHVDGFRMDEMFLFGKAQLAKLITDLRKIEPGVVVLGEPWGNPASGLSAAQQVTPGNQQGIGVGIFNADFRNGICCDSFNNFSTGFANGGGADPAGRIENGVVGSIHYSNNIGDWAAAPSESINYVSNHDNWTLWDHINNYSNAGDTTANKVLMDELAQAIVVTSQGVPFIQGGEEMLRTKNGPNSGNSYDGGDAENQFNWALKNQNISVFNYYAGLFHLRNAHPAFRMTTAAEIQQNLSFLSPPPGGTVAYELNGAAVGDSWSHIIVMYNGTSSSQNLNLPSGSWTIVGNQGHVGTTSLGSASSSVSVPGLTTEILYQ